MAGKKLYWLKVPKDFARKRHVRCMARKGASVAWAYLQILLETLETEGVFEYHADIFDSLADEIADVINSDIETVETMIDILEKFGLIDIRENAYGFREILGWVGSETQQAERMRRYRKRLENALQSDDDVSQSDDDVLKSDTEKEKEKEEEKREIAEKREQIDKESEWTIFLGIISDVIPESKLRNPEKCRDLLADRITETGLTASEIADCVKDFTHDYKSKGNDPMFFKQLERILGDAYGETIKKYATKKAREKKKAQREEEKIDYLNLWNDDLWDDDGEEKSNDFSATWSESWQAFEKVIDRALIPETDDDLLHCAELLEKRYSAGFKPELIATCINEYAYECRKHNITISPLAEMLGGTLFDGTFARMYRKKYGQLATIPADSGNNEEAELPF